MHYSETRLGLHVRVVGNCHQLGGWQPQNGLPMTRELGPSWSASIRIEEDEVIEYKYVICDKDGRPMQWEERCSRKINLAYLGDAIAGERDKITVSECFNREDSCRDVFEPQVTLRTELSADREDAEAPSSLLAAEAEKAAAQKAADEKAADEKATAEKAAALNTLTSPTADSLGILLRKIAAQVVHTSPVDIRAATSNLAMEELVSLRKLSGMVALSTEPELQASTPMDGSTTSGSEADESNPSVGDSENDIIDTIGPFDGCWQVQEDPTLSHKVSERLNSFLIRDGMVLLGDGSERQLPKQAGKTFLLDGEIFKKNGQLIRIGKSGIGLIFNKIDTAYNFAKIMHQAKEREMAKAGKSASAAAKKALKRDGKKSGRVAPVAIVDCTLPLPICPTYKLLP